MDNKNLQLDQWLQPLNSPVSAQGPIPAAQFEMENDIQLRAIRSSVTSFKNFIVLSAAGSAAGTFGNGATLFLNTALSTNPPHQFDINFAVPYIALYQGASAVGSLQIWPSLGAGIPAETYRVYGGLDYQNFSGTNSYWGGYIYNVSGGNQTVSFYSQWKQVFYNNTKNG